jgi:hypothetical protein
MYILIVMAEDAIQLTHRGIKIRADDVAANICQALHRLLFVIRNENLHREGGDDDVVANICQSLHRMPSVIRNEGLNCEWAVNDVAGNICQALPPTCERG